MSDQQQPMTELIGRRFRLRRDHPPKTRGRIARGPGSKTVSRSRSKKSELDGPMRDVVYIFEGEGDRGGGHWRLVLECGHFVARKRYVPRKDMVHAMFQPLSEKLAPKRVQCHYCGSGSPRKDPWIMVKAFGGEVP